MMNDTALLNSLRPLMKDYGEVVTLQKVSSGTYNATSGVVSGSTSQNHLVYGYFFNAVPGEALMSTVEQGRKRIAVYAKKTDGTDLPEPKTTDKIVARGVANEIVEVQVIRANGNPMVYLLRMKT